MSRDTEPGEDRLITGSPTRENDQQSGSSPDYGALFQEAQGKMQDQPNMPEADVTHNEAEPDNAPAYEFVGQSYGGKIESLPPGDPIVEKVQAELLRRRAAILELPSWEEGLDMGRIGTYRQTMAAPNKPIRILTPEDYAAAKTLARWKDPHGSHGGFMPLLDVIIIRRDPEEERLFGTEVTESLIVHEAAHSSSRSPIVQLGIERQRHKRGLGLGRKPQDEINVLHTMHPLRQGFATFQPRRGFFLEEGYAEYERGCYVRDVLGMPDGIRDERDKVTGSSSFLNKYATVGKGEDGTYGLSYTPGAMGAATLELLINHDPELLAAIRGNRHSPATLDDIVADRIDSIEPGLYEAMQQLDMDDPDAEDQAVDMFSRVYKHFQSESR